MNPSKVKSKLIILLSVSPINHRQNVLITPLELQQVSRRESRVNLKIPGHPQTLNKKERPPSLTKMHPSSSNEPQPLPHSFKVTKSDVRVIDQERKHAENSQMQKTHQKKQSVDPEL